MKEFHFFFAKQCIRLCGGIAEGETNNYNACLASQKLAEADPHRDFKKGDAFVSNIPCALSPAMKSHATS